VEGYKKDKQPLAFSFSAAVCQSSCFWARARGIVGSLINLVQGPELEMSSDIKLAGKNLGVEGTVVVLS